MLSFYVEVQQSTSYNFRKDGTMEKHQMSSIELTVFGGSGPIFSDDYIKNLMSQYNVAIDTQSVVDYNDGDYYRVISIHDISPGEEEEFLKEILKELGVTKMEYQYTENLLSLNSGADQFTWKQKST